MSGSEEQKNRNLAKISVAARTALAHRNNIDLINFFSAGPTIRARARIALVSAFLVAAPALFIGVMRTEEVSQHAARLSEYDDYWRSLLEIRIALKELDLAIWAYTVEREFENSQAVIVASEYLKSAMGRIILERPSGLDLGPKGFFEGLVSRLDGLIKRSIANRGSMAQARLSIMSISNELNSVEKRVVDIARKERKQAVGALSMVGRDQLILFLVLLFGVPIFVGFVPGWLVAPLSRLRQIASKIELGQLKELPITGRDEVALLARTLKSYFLRKEELDQKKSSKIFELRNVLRSVINRVNEPVFIVDGSIKINYTNDAAASLIGLPPHQMEGKLISDCMYSPTTKKALEKAFAGNLVDQSLDISIETADGRTIPIKAKIGMVRNRDGEVSRAVIVMYAGGS
jgi:PAS domain S-box-containing protein